MKKPNGASVGSFFIRTRSTTNWYLKHEYYVSGKKHEITVPEKLYPEFGFRSEMLVIEAKERCRRLNGERKIEYGQHVRTGRRAELEIIVDQVYFPDEFVKAFSDHLREQNYGSDAHLKRIFYMFATVQKLVRDLKFTPSQYAAHANRIYKYFIEKKFSYDYSKKLLRILNSWGLFVSKRQGSFFEPVKNPPRGKIRSRMQTAQAEKKGVRRESKILTPELLAKSKSNLSVEQYNWLFISVWLGLRPSEINRLADKKSWSISQQDGTPIISVYQAKLTEISDDERRWKHIPAIFPEMKAAIEIIRSGEFKKPHSKTIQKQVGVGITQYGGRKGFESLMLDRGQKFEDVASWLGHASLETTWRHYRNRSKVRWSKTVGNLKSS